MDSSSSGQEWESQVNQIVEKSSEKIKALTKEKEEIQSLIYKLHHMLQQEEEEKETIRNKSKEIRADINNQKKNNFELVTNIQKLNDELKKINEEIRKAKENQNRSDENFKREIDQNTTKNKQNEDQRERELEKENEELQMLLKENFEQENLLVKYTTELNELQVILLLHL